MLVGKDWISGQIVYYDFITSESKDIFYHCRQQLEHTGFTITGVITDGRPGIREVFTGIPTQMCQFHQIQIVNRYLTKNPKLTPAKQLKTIIEDLPRSTHAMFLSRFHYWLQIHKDFLQEKTTNPITKRKHFTHKRLRSAVHSIQRNLPYLFTYQNQIFTGIDRDLMIQSMKSGVRIQSILPNTTNSLDGWFSHLKKLIRCHPGLRRDRRHKMIEYIIYSSSQNSY